MENLPTEEQTIDDIISTLIADARNIDFPDKQLAAIKAISLAITLDDNVDRFIWNGALPIILKCCRQEKSMQLKEEAVRVMANVTGGRIEHIDLLVIAGILSVIRNLLSSSHLEICKEATLACLNIVAADKVYSEKAVEVSVMRALVALHVHFPEIYVINRRIASILRYMCQTKLLISLVRIIVPVLLALIKHPDMEVKLDVLYAIVHTINHDANYIKIFLWNDIQENMLQFLNATDVKVLTVSLSVLGSIITSFPKEAQFFLKHNLLQYIKTYITHSDIYVVKSGMYCVTALMCNNVSQIQTIIDAGLLPKILYNLCSTDNELKMEIIRAFVHFTEIGTYDQIFALITEGYLIHLCTLLKTMDGDLIILVLQAILSLLRHCGLLREILEAIFDSCDITNAIAPLIVHKNAYIKKLALDIVNNIIDNNPY